MNRFLLVIAASVLTASAAVAAPATITATLAAPYAKSAIVTEHTVWKCKEATCTSRSVPAISNTVSECKVLVSKTGAVSAYGTADDAFDAARLAACNTK